MGADVLTYQSKDYLLVVDYYRKYLEVVEIEDKTSTTIVTKMQEIFARHGIPEELMSDNILFDSQEFRRFTQNYGIKQLTSSLGFAQSNGQSECFIQTIKRMMKKANDDI